MGLGILNPDGHAFFVTAMVILVVCVAGVLLVRKGTTGRYLAAMRGSETAAAGLGINLTWQRVLIFGISGVVAGIGGTLLTIQQQSVSANDFNYEFSLAFVVIVVTTGVSTVEGAINAGFGFVVIQQILTYLPRAPRRRQPGLRALRLRCHPICRPSGRGPRVPEAALDHADGAVDVPHRRSTSETRVARSSVPTAAVVGARPTAASPDRWSIPEPGVVDRG